ALRNAHRSKGVRGQNAGKPDRVDSGSPTAFRVVAAADDADRARPAAARLSDERSGRSYSERARHRDAAAVDRGHARHGGDHRTPTDATATVDGGDRG